jgi:sigma-54 specific flagellar transcriptional regulator A
VRELHNLIERLAVLHPNATVSAADLPQRYRAAWEANGAPPALASVPAPDRGESTPVAALAADHRMSEAEELAAERAALFGAPAAPALDELPEEGLDLKEHIAAIEEKLLRQALDRAEGVVAHAATLLNLRRTTLVEKLRKYGIEREGGEEG